jgi:bifunctional non-homologous end joining protein LigD
VQLVHSSDDGIALHAAALAKRVRGRDRQARRQPLRGRATLGAWLKVKPVQSADFVVGGYTSGKGSRESLGALLLGYWDKQKKLHYASHVGSGFDDRSLKQVQKKLEPLKRTTSPFVEKPVLNGAVTWVEPAVVAEVKFQSWTDDGALRAPVFLRLRDDIDAKSVRRVEPGARHQTAAVENDPIADVVAQLETSNRKNAFTLVVGAEQIRLTHLDRVYWPENPALQQPALTKRDLLRYFAQVSPYMLPHCRPPADDDPHAGRHQQAALLPEALGAGAAGIYRDDHRVLGAQGRKPRVPVVQQPADLAVAGAVRDARIPYLAFARKVEADSISKSTDFATSLESLEESVLNYPTTSCLTSIRTSIRARRRKATSPS